MTIKTVLITCLSLFIITGCSKTDERPNILLIVADDLGYADLGVHGSRIQTPHLDTLAQQGVLFSQFHTAPMCAPTRAMLLSGNNNHVAGMGSQLPNTKLDGTPGFEHELSDRIATMPNVMKSAGYHTYMVGKWHLGSDLSNNPYQAGFERSFALDDGGGNHFDGRGFMPYPSKYFEDDHLADWPEGAYSTNFYTDKLIEFLNTDKTSDQPFFIYAAYTSPHWPLQVPDAELDRYKGAYDEGYEALRIENLNNLKQAGLISQEQGLPELDSSVVPWAELSSEEQKIESRKMELYAAMVSNLDDNIGRLLAHLKQIGKLDNTLVVFMSDNGAAPSDLYNRGPFVKSVRSKYDNNVFEDLGKANSFVSYGVPWAEAGSAPFKYYKTKTTEGGVRAPLIISGAAVKQHPDINHAYLTVMDLAPTFYRLAGAAYPAGKAPLLGSSITDVLAGSADTVHNDDYITVLDHNNDALVRQGNWKLHSTDSFSENSFALYNLLDDPTESTDVKTQHPEIYQRLLDAWQEKTKAYGIVEIPDRVIMK
jgi:arylsulfatase A-like enzyme